MLFNSGLLKLKLPLGNHQLVMGLGLILEVENVRVWLDSIKGSSIARVEHPVSNGDWWSFKPPNPQL